VLLFCQKVFSRAVASSSAEYTPPSLDALLAAPDQLLLSARTTVTSAGANAALSVAIERSNDGVNWTSRSTPISQSNLSFGSATYYGDDTGSTLGGRFQRLVVTFTDCTGTIEVTVAGRVRRSRAAAKARELAVSAAAARRVTGPKRSGCHCGGKCSEGDTGTRIPIGPFPLPPLALDPSFARVGALFGRPGTAGVRGSSGSRAVVPVDCEVTAAPTCPSGARCPSTGNVCCAVFTPEMLLVEQCALSPSDCVSRCTTSCTDVAHLPRKLCAMLCNDMSQVAPRPTAEVLCHPALHAFRHPS